MNKVIARDLEELMNRDIDYSQLKNKTIMVTGANSLLAKYFIYFMMYLNEKQASNIKIIALVRNITTARQTFNKFINSENFIFINQDICDPISYEGNVDYIVHTASLASAYAIVEEPISIISANTIGTLNVLEFAKEKQVAKILFTSTREVYGKMDSNTKYINENDFGLLNQLDSRSCYPESKKMAENMFVCYQKQYNIPYVILRIAHVYGPTMSIKKDGRVMSDFMNFVVNDNNILLNSDGSAIRAFCYISDAIDGITRTLIAKEVNEVYNLANELEPYPIREIAEMLVGLSYNKNLKVAFANKVDEKLKAGYLNIAITQLDTSKIEKLGWKPLVPLKDGLARTLEYFKTND